MKFQTKARNLEILKPILKSAKILPLIIYKKKHILSNLDFVMNEILSKFRTKLIVRSSSCLEDSSSSSHAGEFETLQNITASNLKTALLDVASYLNDDDEIFIQPMLENIEFFAVCMSALNSANYITISYDESGDSKNLTNGDGLFRTAVILKSHVSKNPKFKKIICLINELENLYNNAFIDIEIAFSKNELYLLQVRPIVRNETKGLRDLTSIHDMIAKKFEKLSLKRPHLLGDKTIFGIMPDWNPAEILGLRPKRLAISLYKELITDNIWAYGRDNYGYKNLRSFPLMIDFAGLCYIDTRVSFNSFLPKSIDDKLGEKLVNHWLKNLENNPQNHDKIEFETVLSSYEFDIDEKLKDMNNFSVSEKIKIKNSLKNLTIDIIKPKSRFYEDLERINELDKRVEELKSSNLASIDKIYWLIEECKRYGTISFAGIARAAFIATSVLNSIARVGAISQCEKNEFLNSLSTVSSNLARDINLLTKDDFLKIYGHLRVNTYDITSPRYDESFDEYFTKNSKATNKNISKKKPFKLKNTKPLNNLLKEHGFDIEANELFEFLALAITSRESSKFIFTKALSLALNEIKQYTFKLEISSDDAAFLDIKTLLGFYTTLESLSAKKLILSNIAKNKSEFEITKSLNLPPLICNKDDIYEFILGENEPNFITQKSIQATTASINDSDLNGKIVCINSADPGYDFIFSKGIVGLITAYGGANSHMAVRSNEFGLPAAIGVGEDRFNIYKNAKTITLDCLNKRIIV
ncbi:pyruvate kinase [Campylobacter fetus]|uniref:PEP-utilizing enzyme n=1 Tax=Campylobacter fetus TaxID=196 RepID=UPI000818A78C|nr:PEP-utilizing enzyme [Campylobacter fetus]MPB72227.1 pyruvate kinase [Campylobacter fetus]MPB78077.1 pyruvate kinase [Campylobacter fetus]OCS02548.1 pyruvate kinase [Campylobacter fetus subsp. testudinum]OCS05262.1 pyruvate kinase [Campylobacter fetus subsp. testudinum]